MDTISLTAPAKVNFGLRILRKRPDGFHDIETILQAIDLCDTLKITLSEDRKIRVHCEHPEVPSGPDNLVHKAAHLLRQHSGISLGCRIEVIKRIPPAAGLGGGSSDAAATLTGLNELWSLGLSKEKLHSLAADLGSDVPFFIEGGTAVAQGRGPRQTPLRLTPTFWLVLIKPDFSISTAWAYGQFKIPLTSYPLDVKLSSLKEISHLDKLLTLLDNDLERAVGEKYPAVGHLKRELLSKGAMGAAMSGSGSAVFGIVESRGAAEDLAERIRRAEWQIFVVRPLRRCKGSG